MSTVEVIAIDMVVHNSFLTIINALSAHDLTSLKIRDEQNAERYLHLNDADSKELFSLVHYLCKKKGKCY